MMKDEFIESITGIEFDKQGKLTSIKGVCKAKDLKREELE